MWIIGHRGFAGSYPENTLLSVNRGVAAGADWIEIDIRLVDDAIVVIHDATLERTTNGQGAICDHSIEALRRLDAGEGERIPLLGEVLDAIDARCGLNIEIKQAGLESRLLALLGEAMESQPHWRERIMLSSFLDEPMRRLASRAPAGILLAALCDGTFANSVAFARDIGACSVNISLRDLAHDRVAEAHTSGLRILVYTVNEPDDMARCRDLNVDGLFTDHPDRAIAFLRG